MTVRLILYALAALALGAAPAGAALLYSVDRDTNELVLIDTATGNVFPVGVLDFTPLDVDLTRVGDSLFATNSDFEVSVTRVEIDPVSGATLASAPVTNGGGALTNSESLTQVGGQLLVGFDTTLFTDARTDSLGELDGSGAISNGEAGPAGADFDGLGSDPVTGQIYSVDSTPTDSMLFTVSRAPLATSSFGSLDFGVNDIEVVGDALFAVSHTTDELAAVDLATQDVTTVALPAGDFFGLARANDLGGSLLCNGSFELGAGPDDVPCWDVSGSAARVDTQGATDGSFSLNLNGDDTAPDAVVSQTVATVPGVTYELSFDYGAFSAAFPGTAQQLGVQAIGATTLLDEAVDDTASSPTSFERFAFSFTADSDTTTIEFTDLSLESISVDSNIDDVRLVELVSGGVCGDGVLDEGEQCDDGNTVGGDGCTALCQTENGAFACAPAPVAGCLVAAKASLSISEKKTGNEKLKAKLGGFEGATGQGDLGDPLAGATRYHLCVYDEGGALAAELSVDRAGQTCGPKQKPCWKDKGGKGWLYQDPATEASGTKKLVLGSGPIGKGKALWQAANKAKKGQAAMPTGIAAALAGADSATLQLVTSDAACFEAGLTVKKADGVLFKAKAP